MKVYAVKVVHEDGEILLALYRNQVHAERHRDAIWKPEFTEARKSMRIQAVKIYEMTLQEDFHG